MGKNLFKSGFAQAVVDGDANTGNAFVRTLDRVRRALTGKKITDAPNTSQSQTDRHDASVSDTTVTQNADGVNIQPMQGGEDYSQNALLGKEYFTGDSMTPEARARWMGTPSVADGDTSLGEGGYGADAAMRGVGDAAPYRSATAPIGDVQVVERASQMTAEGKRKASATDFDGILQELGEEETLRRLYNSQQFDRHTGMVEIDGRRVDANAYADAYEQTLPADPAALQETTPSPTTTAGICHLFLPTFAGLSKNIQIYSQNVYLSHTFPDKFCKKPIITRF